MSVTRDVRIGRLTLSRAHAKSATYVIASFSERDASSTSRPDDSVEVEGGKEGAILPGLHE